MLKKTGRKTNYLKKGCVFFFILMLFSAMVYAELPGAADYPHNESSNAISCSKCHIGEPPGQESDLAVYPSDVLCGDCHTGNRAPFEKTHSSLNTSETYGTWSVECITCHNAHVQQQVSIYGSASYLYTSSSTSVKSAAEYSTISSNGAGWTPQQWKGMLVIGNTASSPQVFHKIYDNTGDTLTVEGLLTDVAPGDNFAIVYGGLIKNSINYTKTNVTPNMEISGPTKFFRNTGENSFTSGSPTKDDPPMSTQGICIICHTKTLWHKNDGISSADHYPNNDCISCHHHEEGFKKPSSGDDGSAAGQYSLSGSGGIQIFGAESWTPDDPLKALNDPSAAYNADTKTCSGVYCHSNGADVVNRSFKTTPAWNNGLFGDNKCGSCHDNPPQYDGQSHYTSNGFMGKEGGHLVGIHFDNIYDGSGVLLAAGSTDPSSHGDPTTSTTMTCYLCHNGEISSTAIDTYALANLGSSAMKCSTCHTSPQAGAITDKSLHVNGLKNVTLANAFTVKSKAQLADSSIPAGWTRAGTYKTAGSYDSATMNSEDWHSDTKTCTTACHNGQSATWGATNITCVSCHTELP
jgi:predicted CxxxxCH...CXXCH cytochrome family protein